VIMDKCLNCGKEFEAKRSTAKYCSAKCRKLAFQTTATENANGNAKAVLELPTCVPNPVASRYVRGEPEYMKTIDILLSHTLAELDAAEVWVPAWRRFAGEDRLVDGERAEIDTTPPTLEPSALPANFGQPDCQCMHCQQNRRSNHKRVLNHGEYKPAALLGKNEINRVSLPGDVDYQGVCNDSKYDSRRF